jgi:hypothetical protein
MVRPARVVAIGVLFVIGLLCALCSVSIDLMIRECVNRRLPKDDRLAGFTRSSFTEARRLYTHLYPGGHLKKLFWMSVTAQIAFVLLALLLYRLS